MKRRHLLTLTITLLLAVVFGCNGEDGPLGPAGQSGATSPPGPMKILLAGAQNTSGINETMAGLTQHGGFPLGTVIHTVSVVDSVPPLSVLNQYDAVLVFSDLLPTNADSLGDVLADYADAGGGVVATLYVNHPLAQVTGRFATAGYSPLLIGASSGNGTNPRQVDFGSLSQPLHKVFNGTDAQNLLFRSNTNMVHSTLDATATLIATDNQGANVIAVNATGNIYFVNWWPPGQYQESRPHALRVLGNALACAAGKI